MRARFNRQTQKYGGVTIDPAQDMPPPPQFNSDAERQAYERARKRATAEAGFFVHLMWYGIIIGFLFLINLFTGGFGGYPWWHMAGAWMGLRNREPLRGGVRMAMDASARLRTRNRARSAREVLQEKERLRTEKQASLDELTASFAHEIRNPIAAAKSLVQQMGEDPTSQENVEYAKVALDELQRVESSVSHLLKYAKEEDYKLRQRQPGRDARCVADPDAQQARDEHGSSRATTSAGRRFAPTPTSCARSSPTSSTTRSTRWNRPTASANSTSRIQNNAPGWRRSRFATTDAEFPTTSSRKIFNPFYTSKKPAPGSGLGIAKKVVDSHRGKIEVHSRWAKAPSSYLDSARDAARDASGLGRGFAPAIESAQQRRRRASMVRPTHGGPICRGADDAVVRRNCRG